MDRAYIVTNKEQELDVLKKLDEKDLNWFSGSANLTEWLPSENGFLGDDKFPYILFEREYVFWDNLEGLNDEEVVYDGRKEEKISKLTEEFSDEWLRGFAYAQRDVLSFLDNIQNKVLEHPNAVIDYLKDYFLIDDETLVTDRTWINNMLAEWYINDFLQ